ncbi:MAG TPA: efflux RND transporter periplasmic adaptor subunit [Caulobacteraceae bacterium]
MPEHAPAADAPLYRPKHLRLIGLIALAVAVLLVAVGLIGRATAGAKLKTWTNEQSTPTVALARVTGAANGVLTLPGQVEAFNAAAVNARVSGYLKTWSVDIGDRVKAGQTLAVLDAPELSQQLEQAKADLVTAQANARLAESTNQRWQQLLKDEAASKQDAEEKTGDYESKTALVAAAKANVGRLAETYGFTRITAPFDGVVTARNAQLGQLVNTGGAGAPPLFSVADDSKLRIFVQVPQAYIAQIHVGEMVQLTVPELPGHIFQAALVRTSDAVDRASGTLNAELQIDNKDHVLKPGEYATARFAIAATAQSVTIPASAIMFRDQGPTVGVIGPDGHVSLRKVTIARDLGTAIEIGSGLTMTDQVVDNPTDTLTDGQQVRIAAPQAPGAAGAAHG